MPTRRNTVLLLPQQRQFIPPWAHRTAQPHPPERPAKMRPLLDPTTPPGALFYGVISSLIATLITVLLIRLAT